MHAYFLIQVRGTIRVSSKECQKRSYILEIYEIHEIHKIHMTKNRNPRNQ